MGKNPREFLPGAYVQFLRIAGPDLSDPVTDEALCDGPLLNQVNRLDDKLRAHNQTAVDFTSGIGRSVLPPIRCQHFSS